MYKFSKNTIARFAVLALTPVLALSMGALAGCGTSDAPAGSSEPAGEPAVQEEKKAESDYAVTIDNCTVSTDYEGAPVVIVDYTFTNNSDEATSFAVACNEKVFQNGVELEMAIMNEDLGNGYMAEIKPGATTPVRLAYSTTDQSDVTVEVEEMFSFEDGLLAEKTFTIA